MKAISLHAPLAMCVPEAGNRSSCLLVACTGRTISEAFKAASPRIGTGDEARAQSVLAVFIVQSLSSMTREPVRLKRYERRHAKAQPVFQDGLHSFSPRGSSQVVPENMSSRRGGGCLAAAPLLHDDASSRSSAQQLTYCPTILYTRENNLKRFLSGA